MAQDDDNDQQNVDDVDYDRRVRRFDDDDDDDDDHLENDPEFLRWCRRQRNIDDVDYDIRVRRRTDDEELRKIETNDPTFTMLKIDYDGEDDWEELGTAIGRNTHLTKIILPMS
jgi:hypothetical protein